MQMDFSRIQARVPQQLLYLHDVTGPALEKQGCCRVAQRGQAYSPPPKATALRQILFLGEQVKRGWGRQHL